MYTPSKMTRNLVMGNVGEAFFRYWYETNLQGIDDLTLRQFGYNPEGIVVGEDKVDMLKRLERSTDFAIYRVADLEESPKVAEPILGVSINTQKTPFTMYQSRAPKYDYRGGVWGCYNCPRGKPCYNGNIENLWFNEYNISNDYKLFHEEFKVDVIMVSILSKIPNIVFNGRIRKGQHEKELREYLLEGSPAIEKNHDIVNFLDYLLFDGRYKKRTRPRDYDIVWLKYSDILKGKITYHITGAPVSQGRQRPVACMELKYSRPEEELIELIEGFSEHTSEKRSMTWYVDVGEEGSINS